MSEQLLPSVQIADERSQWLARASWSVIASRCRQVQFLGWLALPFAFYLLPVVLGFSWNALSEAHNVLNPPEGYSGRLPEIRVTVESWGAGVIDVPFHARLRAYLEAGELPLWNPYQGLGEPFAAQGDENPYSPFAIVRALLPYSLGNYVTFAVVYLSSIFLYRFLRGLDLSDKASIFGGTAFALSGAISLQIGRPNLSDQVALVPVILWAGGRAIRERSILSYTILALASALNILGGFIQISMLSSLLVLLFCAFYARDFTTSRRAWVRDAAYAIGAFTVGVGLVGFYLLPLLEGMGTTFNKDVPHLSLLVPIGIGNAVAFFFPMLFGFSFYSMWARAPAVADWENLYAFAGTTVFLIGLLGAAVTHWPGARQRRMYWFFAVVAGVLLLRYVGAAPSRVLDYLPIIGRQSPKHANGVMVFCCVVAAAFAVQGVRAWNYNRVRWLVLLAIGYVATLVLTLVEGPGFTSGENTSIDWSVATPSLLATLYLTTIIAGALWLSSRQKNLAPDVSVKLLTAVVAAELLVYVPLGNASIRFLEVRLALSTLVVGCGLLLAIDRRWSAAALFATTLCGYALLVALPETGLPRQFDLDTPPHFMAWLLPAAGSEYRSFGIAPDHSAIDGIQDISAVGPLAPMEFAEFVQLISDRKTASDYLTTTHFMLAGPWSFSLDQYQRTKPVFDWVGVRYLVLDSADFNPLQRTDDQTLLTSGDGVGLAYQDDRVRIFEAPSARAKVEFWTGAEVYANQAAILTALKQDPAAILGPPKVEATPAGLTLLAGAGAAIQAGTARVEAYRPNLVRVALDTPSAGLLVLKDSYFPGWLVSLNGRPAEILRVNGLVRGVVVPASGQYDVEFMYRPASFVRGLLLTVVSGGLLLIGVAYTVMTKRRALPGWAVLVGGIVALGVTVASAQAYFGPLT